MTFNTSIVQLPVSHINLKDNRFQITTSTDLSRLSDSIKNTGLISLPLIYAEINAGKKPDFIIVSGFRRIKACQYLGMKNIEIRIAGSDTAQIDLVRFAITENAFQRPLNLIEKSRAYSMLSRFFPDNKKHENMLEKEALNLGLSDASHMIKKLLPLCHMPESVQKGLAEDSISLPAALELNTLKPEYADILACLFTDLKLSTSKQREVMNLLKDISLCHEISIKDILDEKNLCEILQNQDIDRNQKSHALRTILKQRRYPAIVQAEKNYEKYLKELKLGQNIKLVPPKDFEGSVYSLILNFSNVNELKEQSKILERIIQEPSLDKILEKQLI
ncbi:ParB-like nuclease domain-containing protein [Desulfonema limicola]|uniref:ParB-like nuclease domain-containing protein n=1 Tax=Desulfonema limicola TaxID=45656 RepID=A0A975B9I8_9BACT|nr:ParB N-terminal domain-containing protein [Desulfonema limicola]QTA81248.1 ParB-like nuclease domain-containing protein [Desulfonema limicola]